MRTQHAALALTAAAAIVAIACSSSSTDSSSSDDSGKYTQTWPTAYADTTCGDWNTQMTDRQQWVAAADMLTGARNKGDGGEGVPTDELVGQFQGGITNACSVDDSEPITEIAAGVYLTDRDQFAP